MNKVMVYDLASGQLARELVPSQLRPGYTLYDYPATQVVGGKGIVAALMRNDYTGNDTVTVWSSLCEMDQLHFFNGQTFRCPNDSCRLLASSGFFNLQVVSRYIVALASIS